MTYAQYGLVQASDFNNLVGNSTSTTANTLNTIWGIGTGSSGYGQTYVPNVSAGGTVDRSDWANLINKTATIAFQTNSVIVNTPIPTTGSVITFNADIPTNLQTIYTNRSNAFVQGSTTNNANTYSSLWTTALTFTHTATFANGDAARYFFNAGGQLAITMSQPTGTPAANVFNALATASGTIVLSSPSSGSVNIVSVNYTGVTKVGGSGTPVTLLTNNGYFALTTGGNNIFQQNVGSGVYINTFIRINAKTNGTVGSNGDNGNIITITTLWDEVPDGGAGVTPGATVTLTVRPPSTDYLSNTWGAISLSSSVVVT